MCWESMAALCTACRGAQTSWDGPTSIGPMQGSACTIADSRTEMTALTLACSDTGLGQGLRLASGQPLWHLGCCWPPVGQVQTNG